MGMSKPMSAKTEAALLTITLALITAPGGELTEPGEMTRGELEQLKGVGLPQIEALATRGILAVRRVGTYSHPELSDDIQLGGTYIYSIA